MRSIAAHSTLHLTILSLSLSFLTDEADGGETEDVAMLRTLERRLTPGGIDVPPSVRYLNMIVGGSEKAELGQSYLDYLHRIKAAAPWPFAGKVFFYCVFPMNEYVSQLEQKVPWAGGIVGKLKHVFV